VAVKIDLHLHGKRRIDVDNCAKSILDGMNGIVYEDDNQVVDLRVRKLRESNKKEQRVEIEVWEAGRMQGRADQQAKADAASQAFFIGNPGKGLWALRRRFFNEAR